MISHYCHTFTFGECNAHLTPNHHTYEHTTGDTSASLITQTRINIHASTRVFLCRQSSLTEMITRKIKKAEAHSLNRTLFKPRTPPEYYRVLVFYRIIITAIIHTAHSEFIVLWLTGGGGGYPRAHATTLRSHRCARLVCPPVCLDKCCSAYRRQTRGTRRIQSFDVAIFLSRTLHWTSSSERRDRSPSEFKSACTLWGFELWVVHTEYGLDSSAAADRVITTDAGCLDGNKATTKVNVWIILVPWFMCHLFILYLYSQPNTWIRCIHLYHLRDSWRWCFTGSVYIRNRVVWLYYTLGHLYTFIQWINNRTIYW